MSLLSWHDACPTFNHVIAQINGEPTCRVLILLMRDTPLFTLAVLFESLGLAREVYGAWHFAVLAARGAEALICSNSLLWCMILLHVPALLIANVLL